MAEGGICSVTSDEKQQVDVGKKSKPRMFRCELCNVRLPYSEDGLEEHLDCPSHKHMKVLLDYGLWPGTSEAVAASQVQPRIYEFADKGNIRCTICNVLVSDATTLLQHQMQAVHVSQIRAKGVQGKVPRILFCDVCDIVFGKSMGFHGGHVYDNHITSGSHKAEEEKKRRNGQPSGSSTVSMQNIGAQEFSDQRMASVISPKCVDKEKSENGSAVESSSSLPSLEEMVAFLGKTFLVGHGLIKDTASDLDVPWMNEELKSAIIQQEFVFSHQDMLLNSELSGLQPPGMADLLVKSKLKIANFIGDLERKAKLQYLRENGDVRELLKRFVCEKKGIAVEKKEKEEKKPEASEASLLFQIPVGWEFGPRRKIDVRTGDATLKKKSAAQTEVKAITPPNIASSKVGNSSAAAVDSVSSGTSLNTSNSTEFTSSSISSSSENTVHKNNLVNNPALNVSGALSSVLNLAAQQSGIHQNSGNFVNMDFLLKALLDQENKLGASGATLDPRQKLRMALLKQLIVERQQAKPTGFDFIGGLIQQLSGPKQETNSISAQEDTSTSDFGRVTENSTTDSGEKIILTPAEPSSDPLPLPTRDWDGVLDSVLRQTRNRALETEVSERWNGPRMCWVWDGDPLLSREFIMDVSDFHVNLAIQEEAKKDKRREEIDRILRAELGYPNQAVPAESPQVPYENYSNHEAHHRKRSREHSSEKGKRSKHSKRSRSRSRHRKHKRKSRSRTPTRPESSERRQDRRIVIPSHDEQGHGNLQSAEYAVQLQNRLRIEDFSRGIGQMEQFQQLQGENGDKEITLEDTVLDPCADLRGLSRTGSQKRGDEFAKEQRHVEERKEEPQPDIPDPCADLRELNRKISQKECRSKERTLDRKSADRDKHSGHGCRTDRSPSTHNKGDSRQVLVKLKSGSLEETVVREDQERRLCDVFDRDGRLEVVRYFKGERRSRSRENSRLSPKLTRRSRSRENTRLPSRGTRGSGSREIVTMSPRRTSTRSGEIAGLSPKMVRRSRSRDVGRMSPRRIRSRSREIARMSPRLIRRSRSRQRENIRMSPRWIRSKSREIARMSPRLIRRSRSRQRENIRMSPRRIRSRSRENTGALLRDGRNITTSSRSREMRRTPERRENSRDRRARYSRTTNDSVYGQSYY